MNTVLYIVLFILSIVFVAWVVMVLVDFISKKRRDRRKLQEEATLEKEKEKELYQERLAFVGTLAFWLTKLEDEHSTAIDKVLKVKEPLFDEYKRLKHIIHVGDYISSSCTQFWRDRYIIGGAEYRQLLPFIGYDDIYYAIAISSYADKMTAFKDDNIDQFIDDTFKVELVPYCQDKFINKKVEPVSYDPIYLPRMAFDSKTWRVADTYKEVIFYDT